MERLHELRRRRAELAAKLAQYVKADEDRPEDESTPQEAVDAFEDIGRLIAELDGRIQRLEAAMAADASSATDDGEAAGRYSSAGAGTGLRVAATAKPKPVEGKGFSIARYMVGVAWMKWHGAKTPEMILNRFGDEAVSKALNTMVVAEGGALIPQDFMAEMIELLRANTVMRAAGPMTVTMPMGNLTIPRLAGGSTAAYQGELDDISLTEEVFDDLDLIAKKLTAMVPVSNDLIRRAPIGIETIVRDDLVAGVARREDLAFIRGDGTGKSPVGWRSLVLPGNLIVVPAGGNLDAVVSTLAAMKLTLTQGMSRMIRPVWVGSATIFEFIATRRDEVGGFYYRDEVRLGTLEGIPFYATQQIPTNLGTGNGTELYLADMADTIIADTMNVQVDASDVAAYYGTDGDVVSTFQRDQTLFRIISEHDFNMRHLQSLAVAILTDWFFAGLPASGGRPFSTQPLNPHWAQAPAAWPSAATHDPAPTIYDPAMANTSDFDGELTDNPGGGPYPLVDQTRRADDPHPEQTPRRGGRDTPTGGGDDTTGGASGGGGPRRPTGGGDKP